MNRPNILYIHSHDTGRYVQPYGHAIRTPHIQQLAEQGVLFRNAFCANPTCSPSRSALLTGQYPHNNGMIGLAHRGARLNDYRQHLASCLRQNGYLTALSGMQHEINTDERALLGYEQFLDGEPVPGQDSDTTIAQRAAEFLATPHDRPFFLSCGFFLTHRRGQGTQWHNTELSPVGDPRYARPPAPLPDTAEARRDMADFVVSAERLDACMGRVFKALEVAGLADNTLVICTTDHGIAFPFMKCNLTDHGIGVMLMLRGPGGFQGGQAIDAMVTHMDLFPTVCEVAGIQPPAWLQGESLTPLVTGKAERLHEEIFSEVNYHAAYEPVRAVRTTRYKYIRRYDARQHPVLPNCDDSVSKDELLRNGWGQRSQDVEQLFDLVFDPNEAANVAACPDYAGVLADMRGRLDRWMQATHDPLLTGPVTPLPGMVVNLVEGISPQEPTVPARGITRG